MDMKWLKEMNFRDLSYLVNAEGKRLKPGLFLRSGALVKAPRPFLRMLQAQRLATVIDLRTAAERNKRPDVKLDGVLYVDLPVVKEERLGITHERGLKAYKTPPHMPDLYAHLVSEPESVAAYKRALGMLFDLNREGSVLWHCTAGKDRAGILTALFLTALGYPLEDILTDYELSNERSERKGRLYRAGILLIGKGKSIADAVYRAMLAPREYLLSAFDAMKRQCGSAEAFIQEKLGITPEMVESFWAKYGDER